MSDSHPDKTSDTFVEPPRLRLLRLLVTVLTVTLIIGFVIIVGLLVTMVMGRKQPATLIVPEEIALPEGETALSFSRGTDWIAVVTRSAKGAETIRIFTLGGEPMQAVAVRRPIGSE